MPIKFTRAKKASVAFSSLKAGDTFITRPDTELVFIKTERIKLMNDETSDFNCVLLSDGTLDWYSAESRVYPINFIIPLE